MPNKELPGLKTTHLWFPQQSLEQILERVGNSAPRRRGGHVQHLGLDCGLTPFLLAMAMALQASHGFTCPLQSHFAWREFTSGSPRSARCTTRLAVKSQWLGRSNPVLGVASSCAVLDRTNWEGTGSRVYNQRRMEDMSVSAGASSELCEHLTLVILTTRFVFFLFLENGSTLPYVDPFKLQRKLRHFYKVCSNVALDFTKVEIEFSGGFMILYLDVTLYGDPSQWFLF